MGWRRKGPTAAALLIAGAWPAVAKAQAAAPAVTSAPYDLSLFRDGETRRMRARYGSWTVVCDEIIRLRSRYCSLAAEVADAVGTRIARLDVSTDDAGRPTALLHLPNGTLFDRPILVAPAGPRPKTSGSAGNSEAHAIRATTCDGRECAAVWTLARSDFDALGRDGLILTYRLTQSLDRPASLLASPDVATLSGLMPSDGFSSAIAASLRSGPLSGGDASAGAPDTLASDQLGLKH